MIASFGAARGALIATTVAALLAACGGTKGGRSDYVRDGDTGQAAPATVPEVNHPDAPDSTAGVSQRTGSTAPSGDTIGAKGKATGGTNPTASGKTGPVTRHVP